MSRATARASLKTLTSRAANARSFNSCANRSFQGHTLWEMSRYTHFEIPLSAGWLTLTNALG